MKNSVEKEAITGHEKQTVISVAVNHISLLLHGCMHLFQRNAPQWPVTPLVGISDSCSDLSMKSGFHKGYIANVK
jgi:hypothetical protein